MKISNNFWRKYFHAYNHLTKLTPYNELLDETVRAVIKYVENDKSARLVELGVGTGNLLIKLIKAGFSKVLGIDENEQALSIAQKVGIDSRLLVRGKIQNVLPIESESVDLVVALHTIYWVSNNLERIATIKEVGRILRPGGKILVVNPLPEFQSIIIYKEHVLTYYQENGLLKTSFEILRELPNIIILWRLTGTLLKEKKGGSSYYSDADIRNHLKMNGFRIVQESTVYANQSYLIVGKKNEV